MKPVHVIITALCAFSLNTVQAAALPASSKSNTLTYLDLVKQKKITKGEGIALIVKTLKLNIDNIRFIKAPKATDYFPYANNKAAYAEALIIAANNGITLTKQTRFEGPMTRELFAVALEQAITAKRQYVTNMMWIQIADEKTFSKGGLSAVQKLIKLDVVSLDKAKKFRPKAYITPAEAKAILARAVILLQAPVTEKEAAPEGSQQ